MGQEISESCWLDRRAKFGVWIFRTYPSGGNPLVTGPPAPHTTPSIPDPSNNNYDYTGVIHYQYYESERCST
jgi:hypothetical protein